MAIDAEAVAEILAGAISLSLLWAGGTFVLVQLVGLVRGLDGRRGR